eukprot:scaffold1190_cov393-Prasinococcus_capsulatus_cf.AAC.30
MFPCLRVPGADTSRVKVVLSVETSLLEEDQSVYFKTSDARVSALVNEEVSNCTSNSNEKSISAGEWARMSDACFPLWQISLSVPREAFPLKYAYGILSDDNGACELEDCGERTLDIWGETDSSKDRNDAAMGKGVNALGVLVRDDGNFKLKADWRGAGLALPVFSIRSRECVGSGEFLDLKLVVDVAVSMRLQLVQLLPVNDTSVYKMWCVWDSYPYSSLSVFALHPLYLRLSALRSSFPADIAEEIQRERIALNQEQVDYERTVEAKLRIAKKCFLLDRDQLVQDGDFGAFLEENSSWLKAYAVFCFLRDLFGTAEHWHWGKLSKPSQEDIDRLADEGTEYYGTILFHYYLQYHLHLQLTEASAYAKHRGVVLKGDLPIGVDRRSVDTWVFPSLFRMDKSTGAPPDYFDPNGQNWGFPTYNWEEMSLDNYAWWRARLTQMSKYFSAYRIDHILGFFRIWEMPSHAVTGLVGRFRPTIPIWKDELEASGVWDFDRLTVPYIRYHTVEAIFGEQAPEIVHTFMNETSFLCYAFKPEFDTEIKLKEAVEKLPGPSKEDKDKMLKGLFTLIQNIVLIKDPADEKRFYPRFALAATSSYKELDDHLRSVLFNLHESFFFERQNEFWRANALKTLPVIMKSSDMLVCGEDLGMVPACVPPVLEELGLLGLRIQRMGSKKDEEFGEPSEYEYMTVCSPSCHDVPPCKLPLQCESTDKSCLYTADVSSACFCFQCGHGMKQILRWHSVSTKVSWASVEQLRKNAPPGTTSPI